MLDEETEATLLDATSRFVECARNLKKNGVATEAEIEENRIFGASLLYSDLGVYLKPEVKAFLIMSSFLLECQNPNYQEDDRYQKWNTAWRKLGEPFTSATETDPHIDEMDDAFRFLIRTALLGPFDDKFRDCARVYLSRLPMDELEDLLEEKIYHGL